MAMNACMTIATASNIANMRGLFPIAFTDQLSSCESCHKRRYRIYGCICIISSIGIMFALR